MNDAEQARSGAVSEVFKALGHPSRVFIAETLREGERCVCEMSAMVGADVSTVSRHLAVLRKAGIVTDRKEGTTVYYSLACDCLGQMLNGARSILRMRIESQTLALAALRSE